MLKYSVTDNNFQCLSTYKSRIMSHDGLKIIKIKKKGYGQAEGAITTLNTEFDAFFLFLFSIICNMTYKCTASEMPLK